MPRPFLVVQLSDPHIGADWGDGDPVANLAATVAEIRALELSPGAVLISGDVADHAADAEYELLRELLAPLDAPLYALPGNHDGRAALRRHFDAPGTDDEPVQYAADIGPLRLVALDTVLPGEDGGELGPQRIGWLQTTLADAPETPTIVALHHPPLLTGATVVDDIGLRPADQLALGEVVRGHAQVRRIVAGHLHWTISADLDGCGVLVAPSTYVQAVLDFDADEIRLSAEPPGFVVHAWLDGELVSYVRAVS